jgi:hypothetical protein
LAIAARKKKEAKTAIQRSQDYVHVIYNCTPFQMSSALLIFLNFFISAVEAQVADQIDDDNGARTRVGRLIEMGNTILTILFFIELLINLYAHWFREFFSAWMNIWDAVIVTLSVASLGPLELAMPVNILRFFRVVRILRVLKIFSRLPELKRIISALSHSLIPMLNAFLIVLVVMAIYSIIGVTYFRDQAWPKHAQHTCCNFVSSSIAHRTVPRLNDRTNTTPFHCFLFAPHISAPSVKPEILRRQPAGRVAGRCRTTSASSTGRLSPCSASRPAKPGSDATPILCFLDILTRRETRLAVCFSRVSPPC